MFQERRIPVGVKPPAVIPSMPHPITPQYATIAVLSKASPAAPRLNERTQHRSERTDTGKNTHSRT